MGNGAILAVGVLNNLARMRDARARRHEDLILGGSSDLIGGLDKGIERNYLDTEWSKFLDDTETPETPTASAGGGYTYGAAPGADPGRLDLAPNINSTRASTPEPLHYGTGVEDSLSAGAAAPAATPYASALGGPTAPAGPARPSILPMARRAAALPQELRGQGLQFAGLSHSDAMASHEQRQQDSAADALWTALKLPGKRAPGFTPQMVGTLAERLMGKEAAMQRIKEWDAEKARLEGKDAEDVRHNKATEGLGGRELDVRDAANKASAAEAAAREKRMADQDAWQRTHGDRTATETERHNRQGETTAATTAATAAANGESLRAYREFQMENEKAKRGAGDKVALREAASIVLGDALREAAKARKVVANPDIEADDPVKVQAQELLEEQTKRAAEAEGALKALGASTGGGASGGSPAPANQPSPADLEKARKMGFRWNPQSGQFEK